MAAPAILGIGKALGGKKLIAGIGKAVGGLFKKKAGGTAVGNALRGVGKIFKKKDGGTKVGNALRSIFGGKKKKKAAQAAQAAAQGAAEAATGATKGKTKVGKALQGIASIFKKKPGKGKSTIGKIIEGAGGIPGLLSIGASGLTAAQGAKQQKEARAMLESLKDPGYEIPEEFQQNLAEAQQMARSGLPAQEYNLAATNIQRGTQAGLRQLGRMSNPFAGIAGLSRAQSQSFADLDAANAAARRQNILGAMSARRELAGQKLAKQQYGQQRFMDQMNQANALLGAGMQNVAGGLGSLGQYGMYQSIYGGDNSGTQVPSVINEPNQDVG